MQEKELPRFKDCTGCMACSDACKHKAISIDINKKDFMKSTLIHINVRNVDYVQLFALSYIYHK